MGWGPVSENAEPKQPWYMPAKTRLRCAHCGAVVKEKSNSRLFILGIFCLALAWVSNSKLNGSPYHLFVTGGLAVLGVALMVTSAITKKYETTE